MYFAIADDAGSDGVSVQAEGFSAGLRDKILYRHRVREESVNVYFGGSWKKLCVFG
jgi:hypothetical protein